MPVMRRTVIAAVAGTAAAFHLYSAGISPFTALVQRPLHLGLMAALGFLGVGVRVAAARNGDDDRPTRGHPRARALDLVLLGLLVGSVLYLALQHEAVARRAGAATSLDIVAGLVTIALVLELARRTTGSGLPIVALVALAYGVSGPWLPGVLAHRGYGPQRIVEHLFLSTEGIWGVPLGVSADFVYLFVLFGALLERAGGSQLLIGLARRAAGTTRGGPAKTATVASALMGSLSGSAVANVVTTGTLTIPMMRRAGFRPHLAAAIEAAASTGGQLMPPIMGAGAFILSAWTGIPYGTVAVAAALPALLYYTALFAAIHFAATANPDVDASETEPLEVRARLHLLLPLAIIVALLARGRSPMRAAFWGVVAAAVLSMLGRQTRLGPSAARDVLVAAASGTVQVAAACAAAGIVVGVATLTGIGLRLSGLIVDASGGSLAIGLVLTALGSVILGMGLPTTGAYVVLAALGAPALVELGAPLLAAHLFIFYFGCLSNVTPPVALAAYAAAGVAGASASKVAFRAMTLAATGFVVPFVFTLRPELLLFGAPIEVLAAAITAVGGVIALAAAVGGHHNRRLHAPERVVLAAGAIGLLQPGLAGDALGAGVMAASFGWARWKGGD